MPNSLFYYDIYTFCSKSILVFGNCTTVALGIVEVSCGCAVFSLFFEETFPLAFSLLFVFLLLVFFFVVVVLLGVSPSLLFDDDRLPLLLAATIFEHPSRKKYEPIPTAIK